jgi:protein-disulfide isomerase
MEKNTLAVPFAIVVSALIIAGAIFFVSRDTSNTPPPDGNSTTFTEPTELTESDHVLGNPNAEVVYIEYSDFECPFCKLFHETMNNLLDEFGSTGDVAWAFRHFPLPIQGHENGPKIAEGSECATELGGNEAFWAYSNAIFAQDVANIPTSLTVPAEIAKTIDLDVTAFTECVDSGKYQEKVAYNFADARDSGGNGTPYTVALLQAPLTEAQQSDIRLLANQLQIPANLITYSENTTAIAFSGNLPLTFMRAVTQILLGIPVDDGTTTPQAE